MKKSMVCLLIACIALLPLCGAFATGSDLSAWDGDVYTNASSGIIFTLPEGWINHPEGLPSNPLFDVLVADQDGASAIAIGLLDMNTMMQMVPMGAYGQFLEGGVQALGESAMLEMIASMFAAAGTSAPPETKSVMVGENPYMMITFEENGLMQSILLRMMDTQLSILFFTSSNHMEPDRFLLFFS